MVLFDPRPQSIEVSTGVIHGKTLRQHRRRNIHFSKNSCFYCGKETIKDSRSPMFRTLDHVIPRSRGGIGIPFNKVCACKLCNSRKGSLLLEEFKKKLGIWAFPGEEFYRLRGRRV